MDIRDESRNGACILTFQEKRLDAKVSAPLKRVIQEKLDEGHKHIVLDLRAVSFMDSSGLGVLVAAYKAVDKSGSFALVGVDDGVREVLHLTRMDRVFKILDTVDQAVREVMSV